MILLEFLKSPLWLDIRVRVLTTLGFTGVGTAAHALPSTELTTEQSINLIQLEYLISVFTLISYGLSMVVAVTVIWRFIIWLKDRKNNKNN